MCQEMWRLTIVKTYNAVAAFREFIVPVKHSTK